ncbi:MAG TPA: T9SS type A sorting domain-containing protein [Bacteroidales bacterium]|nr:T9SS type A sorting domain-containing protein [Bacteroidales bacterium]
MKISTINTLIAILFLMSSFVAFSQSKKQAPPSETISNENPKQASDSRSLIFSEDFSTGTFPPSGWSTVGVGQQNWAAGASNLAGGVAPEAVFTGLPGFTGNSKLVTPIIATTPDEMVILQFNHFAHDYGSGYTLLVETTGDGTNWNEVWSVDVDGSISPETVFVAIENDDLGSYSFQIAFTFSGNSSKIFSWHLDNIMLNENLAYDAEATNILVPSLAGYTDKIAPLAVLTNMGSETISFDATVEILDATSTVVYTETMTVADLPSFERKVLTFPRWTAIVGTYTVNLTTSLAGDENPDNDLATSTMEILENVIFKQPLYEEFTSSTCAPCAMQNPALDAVLAANPITHSLIKYQVNWPGVGDPYYTPECSVRTNYYGNSQAPKLYINSNSQWVAGMTQAVYDSYIGLPTTMAIDIVTAYIDPDGNVTIDANINVTENLAAGLKLHIAVVEKTTHGNVATNGETEFNNVMLKMLPNASGTTLEALTIGNTVAITESYNMSQTFMEEPADLAVIVFVQDDSNKNILQSEMMDISILTGIENPALPASAILIFPNPASNHINIHSESAIQHLFVFNQMGQTVFETQADALRLNVDISNLERGIYLFKVITEKGSSVRKVLVE